MSGGGTHEGREYGAEGEKLVYKNLGMDHQSMCGRERARTGEQNDRIFG